MPMRLFALLIVSVLLGACAASTGQEQANASTKPGEPVPMDTRHEITIVVPNVGTDTAYLAYYQGATQYLKDTTVGHDGTFVFAGDEPLPPGMYLAVFPPANRYFDFIVNRDQTFTLRTDTADFAGNMKVEGSEENQVFYDHIAYLAAQRAKATPLNGQLQGLAEGSPEREAVQKQLEAINEEVMAERKRLKTERSDLLAARILTGSDGPEVPDPPADADEYWGYRYYKGHFFDYLDLSDEGLMRSPIMERKITEYLDNLTAQHPDSLIEAVDLLIEKARPNDETFRYLVSTLVNKYAEKANELMGMDGVYLHIVEKYYASGQAWWLDEEQLADLITKAEKLSPIIIGRPGLDFTITDVNGQPQSLYGVKADWIILYFWDYDCGRCKKVTPELAKLFPTYKNRGVQLFTVNINGDNEVWKEKLKEYGLMDAGGIHTSDPYRKSGFDKKYNINSTPKIFILDSNHIIRYKWIGVDQLPEILDRELSKL
ncbi:MAG: DUF5106 domain-containing protein [Bacteroidetes bacterium]|nr:MAG: DUF5106 domain-containing protein [Bacteroidota bacterium]